MVEILRLENGNVDLVFHKDYIAISMIDVTVNYKLKRGDYREILHALIDSDSM